MEMIKADQAETAKNIAKQRADERFGYVHGCVRLCVCVFVSSLSVGSRVWVCVGVPPVCALVSPCVLVCLCVWEDECVCGWVGVSCLLRKLVCTHVLVSL